MLLCRLVTFHLIQLGIQLDFQFFTKQEWLMRKWNKVLPSLMRFNLERMQFVSTLKFITFPTVDL